MRSCVTVSQVHTMQGAFSYATDFNQDIGAWNVARATNMFSLFRQAVNFDQDLSRWQSTLDHFFKFRPSRKIMKSSFSSIFVPSLLFFLQCPR